MLTLPWVALAESTNAYTKAVINCGDQHLNIFALRKWVSFSYLYMRPYRLSSSQFANCIQIGIAEMFELSFNQLWRWRLPSAEFELFLD